MLIVGAATWDVFGAERRPGGAVAYAARAAAALGIRARVLTIAGPDAELSALCGHELTVVAATRTLTFEHALDGEQRLLRLIERPQRPLRRSDLPPGWEDSQVLVLGPLLADDIDMDSFAGLQARWRGLLAQGLLREAGDDGRVSHSAPSARLLSEVDERTSVFVSEEESADWDEQALASLLEAAERVVVTRGKRGAEVLLGADGGSEGGPEGGPKRIVVGAPAATAVDTTGSGDVFAAAFMIALARGADDAEAGRIGAELAATAVERVGALELPSLVGRGS